MLSYRRLLEIVSKGFRNFICDSSFFGMIFKYVFRKKWGLFSKVNNGFLGVFLGFLFINVEYIFLFIYFGVVLRKCSEESRGWDREGFFRILEDFFFIL